MPIIVAMRTGPCAGCGGRINMGEQIDFSRATGARHLTCTDVASGERTNRHPATCADCLTELARGQGLLELVEDRTDGTRTWKVTCRDRPHCLSP